MKKLAASFKKKDDLYFLILKSKEGLFFSSLRKASDMKSARIALDMLSVLLLHPTTTMPLF